MKTLEEIYNEVFENNELTEKYKSLRTAEEQMAFVRELGGEATAEEIADFWDRQNSKFGELTDAELEQVVGGKGSTTYYHSNCGGVISERIHYPNTAVYYCEKCGEEYYSLADFSYYTA